MIRVSSCNINKCMIRVSSCNINNCMIRVSSCNINKCMIRIINWNKNKLYMVRHPKSVGWRYLPFHFFNPAIHSVQLYQLQSNSIVTQNYFITIIVTEHSQIAKHVHVVVIFCLINFDLDIHILLLYMHLKCFRFVTI